MNSKENKNLIIDENTVYEIDEECMKEKGLTCPFLPENDEGVEAEGKEEDVPYYLIDCTKRNSKVLLWFILIRYFSGFMK